MKKSKLRSLDKYCIYCIVFFTLYTIVTTVINYLTGYTNDRLTEAVQWFCGGELFLCAMLKRLKLKREVLDDSSRLCDNSDSNIADNTRRD